MWYEKFTFYDKQEGLTAEIEADFFTRPTTDEEFECIAAFTNGKTKADFSIPTHLKLPQEFVSLLQYANGGGIINGEREFGYFDLHTIREMYMCYGFLIWAPNHLPIAFNGGGEFYVYNFNHDTNKPSIDLVPASCLGDDENCAFLGYSLEEVLSKPTNVEDEHTNAKY